MEEIAEMKRLAEMKMLGRDDSRWKDEAWSGMVHQE